MTAIDGFVVPVPVTDDAFLGGRLQILQPKSGYRAGVDAVLLAAAAPVQEGAGQTVLDCGAGVGTVGLCVAARIGDARIALLERDPVLAELATENARRNNLSDRVRVIVVDVHDRPAQLSALGVAPDTFDHVLLNPPFHEHGSGTASPDALKAGSHAMASGDLENWLRLAARVVRPGGTVTLIHKTEELTACLMAAENRFGELKILPIYPRAEALGIRILLRGVKGSRAPLTLLPPFVLHDEQGFCLAASDILRHSAALKL